MPNSSLNLKQIPLPLTAKKLVAKGLLDAKTAQDMVQEAMSKKVSFFNFASKESSIPFDTLASAASDEFGIPFLNISRMDFDRVPINAVKAELLERHRVIPLAQRGETLFLGITDPSNVIAIDDIKFNTGGSVQSVLVHPEVLDSLLDSLISNEEDGLSLDDLMGDDSLEDIEIGEETAEEKPAETMDLDIDSPIVRYVYKLLQDAIKAGASDIHIEPYEKYTRIRFRIDGILHETAKPPIGLTRKLTSRIKILARLDIAEKRIPQDGRMKIKFSRKRTIDFRVNTLPVVFGEKIVIRILDNSAANLNLEVLGMDENQLALYKRLAVKPQGMILVTGPTGSGKTVTLYSALRMLNDNERNISSVEDPVEIHITGLNQVNINEKAGLTFASALRAFLRQDPDIIMIGEIRDLETAEIGIKAAQTGHLVLSTLHTNDGPSTLSRLANMGVAPYNIASTVTLIIAQRLVRRLCESCKKPTSIKPEVLQQIGLSEAQISEEKIFDPVGCPACTSGYRGRAGIYEVLPVSDDMADIIMDGGSVLDLERQARKEGINNMRQSGLNKVALGITSIDEVERVTTD